MWVQSLEDVRPEVQYVGERGDLHLPTSSSSSSPTSLKNEMPASPLAMPPLPVSLQHPSAAKHLDQTLCRGPQERWRLSALLPPLPLAPGAPGWEAVAAQAGDREG